MGRYRAGVLLMVLAGLLSFSGASCPYFRRPIDDFANLPPALPPSPTLDQVIQVVNNNSSQIRSFSAPQATLSGTGFPTLQASVAYERPQRLRLRAGTGLTGPELDLGSNDELFWFWGRRNQPPGLYYCRHAQFASSPVRQTLLIDPYWLIEALGVAELDPALPHQGPVARSDGRLEIRTVRETPGGPSTKITVLDRVRGLVLEQHVLDARNQLVASAAASQHRRDPLSGLVLPTIVDLRLPAQQMTMRLSLGNVQINRPLPNPEQLWAMPAYEGWPPVDLCNPNLTAPPGYQAPAVSSRLAPRYPGRPGVRYGPSAAQAF
jgi:hypothetical protein